MAELENIDLNEQNIRVISPASVCNFYLEGKCRFGENCFNVHEGDIPQDKIRNKAKNPLKNVLDTKIDEINKSPKKAPLRTAGDVRKRIQWDTALPEEYFSVGYLDRFEGRGVVEKPFTFFTWIDLACADLDQLAIPQHRIQYFKYKDKKIWDKNEWLDLVFGSSGNEKTILDVMAEVDAELAEIPAFDEDSSDDEDNVFVGQMDQTPKDIVRSVKEKEEMRATHFLCVRIDNSELAELVREVQDHISQQDPTLKSCAMPTEILHVTLTMVKCDTKKSIEVIKNIMEDLKQQIEQHSDKNSNKIIAEQLSTFGSRVLYSKLKVPDIFWFSLKYLQEKLRYPENVTITNLFDFVPHMTLFKIGRKVAKDRRSQYINSSFYSDFYDKYFGEIVFDNLYFCEINDDRGFDGFYETIHKIEF